MNNVSDNNKRIAKNTLLLYIRMFITMSISLYTSRIVLEKLGVVDYGINNVVAGMVTMFTFLNSTLATGTQRFITFALGENNFSKLKKTFSTTFIIHFFLSLLIGLAILIGGLYFLNNELSIPIERLDAAYWVFYCSIIIVILNITQVPFMSSIIAHEDMGIYAYVSIFEGLAKLGVAFALTVTNIDKLKLYAILMTIVQLCNIIFYRIYCVNKYSECRIEWKFNKSLAKNILTFSGWNIFGCTSVLLNNQGFNMLLNVFYGPFLNTARGISNQVNSIAMQFVNNFQTAVNPQIIKYFAEKELEKMNNLIYNNSRFSGLLVMYIIIPLMIELPFLLNIWLGNYPYETIFLTRIILIQTLITSMNRSVVMGIHATGKMKTVNLLAGTTLLLSLPICYILFSHSFSLNFVMYFTLIPWLIETFIELLIMKKYVGISMIKFYKNSYLIVISIGILMVFPLVYISIKMEASWFRFIINMTISAFWGAILIYKLGLTTNMRVIIKEKIINKLKK